MLRIDYKSHLRTDQTVSLSTFFFVIVGCDLEELLKTADILKIERASEVLKDMIEDKNVEEEQELEEPETM